MRIAGREQTRRTRQLTGGALSEGSFDHGDENHSELLDRKGLNGLIGLARGAIDSLRRYHESTAIATR